MPSEINAGDIAVLASEVSRLTEEVKHLLSILTDHRLEMANKANTTEVSDLSRQVLLLIEREQVGRMRDLENSKQISKIRDEITKLQMETWKLGLLFGGSATGGGILALLAQWIFKSITI